MLCANPYVPKAGTGYGCGQCLPCRINRKRVWTHRIMLEAYQHPDNCFVTLTYNDENVPHGGTLAPLHTQLFLKKLRRKVQDRKLRYFLVGEYGDESERPHYHLALFNYPTCVWGTSQYSEKRINCCPQCDIVRDAWGLGFVGLGMLEPYSAAYIAGYVTKKMTSHDDIRLNGRHPEFARMSLRPGIGGFAADDTADILLRQRNSYDDVPTALRHGAKLLPLGRYITRRLRERVGREPGAPAAVLQARALEMQPLLEAAELATAHQSLASLRRTVFKNMLIDQSEGKRRRLEHLQKLRKRKKLL